MESGAQCLEHSFDFVNALSDYYETLRWIDVALRLTAALPLGLRSDNLLAHRGDLAAQDFGEEFGLGTFRTSGKGNDLGNSRASRRWFIAPVRR